MDDQTNRSKGKAMTLASRVSAMLGRNTTEPAEELDANGDPVGYYAATPGRDGRWYGSLGMWSYGWQPIGPPNVSIEADSRDLVEDAVTAAGWRLHHWADADTAIIVPCTPF